MNLSGLVLSKDIIHEFDTQNYPKLQASLGTQPENTHGIQTQGVAHTAKIQFEIDKKIKFKN